MVLLELAELDPAPCRQALEHRQRLEKQRQHIVEGDHGERGQRRLDKGTQPRAEEGGDPVSSSTKREKAKTEAYLRLRSFANRGATS